jgi:heme/copper-type cytochrome/quinol oxidase subunit 1
MIYVLTFLFSFGVGVIAGVVLDEIILNYDEED